MIYTVTFNPSLDYVVALRELRLGEVNRAEQEVLNPGGKGINVSVVLSNLGVCNTALGFLAGFTGRELERRLRTFGCRTDFISLPEGLTRINVKLKAECESEINGLGPDIPPDALSQLYEKLDALGPGDALVLAGSIPATLPSDVYEQIMARLSGRGVDITVDATNDLLRKVLRYRPFLIKPNNHELSELFGIPLETDEEIIRHARRLQELGARTVLVSLAARGAILLTETGEVYQSLPPDGTVRNSVGAGDSMVAGFLTGYQNTSDYQKALTLGLAAGSASAFLPWLTTRDDVAKLLTNPTEYGI